MYAVIETGGKQYKVTVGEVLKIEKIEAEVGDIVEFDILMAQNDSGMAVGAPKLDTVVKAEVLAQDKYKKIIVYKYKSKKNSRRKKGHRQPFTSVKITEILARRKVDVGVDDPNRSK